ncbi:MAG: Maf-like protein [Thermoanaerobacterales bacterium 50_218]|nr:MAG: Maf-like protein [Thermoanaerobacterales bacterium 50_218]
MPRIILASSSPRRIELLKQLGISFQVVPSGIPEVCDSGCSAADVALQQAKAKAEAVAEKHPQEIVIAADTVVCCDREVLGKPRDWEDAARMLRKLSGKVHEVHTGLVLWQKSSQQRAEDVVTTRVYFRNLEEREIFGYLATGEPFDKAGGYGIQGYGALLVEKIEGCYYNVVGLPLARLGEMLKGFGVDLLCQANTASE